MFASGETKQFMESQDLSHKFARKKKKQTKRKTLKTARCKSVCFHLFATNFYARFLQFKNKISKIILKLLQFVLNSCFEKPYRYV